MAPTYGPCVDTKKLSRDGRLFGLSPFRLFAIAGLIGTLAIGGGSVFASQQAGESEAMAEVRSLTELVAKTVVEPNLSNELLAGDLSAINALDDIVSSRVIDATTVRVKLWNAEGRVVYSDEPRLIGEQYELGDEKNESLWSGAVVSEISSLEGPENRFEVDQGQLLEVYLPVEGPDGGALLYESYFAMSGVTDSASRIRANFLPVILGALVLMEVLHLGLAFRLSRRHQRHLAERERLLQRAIDSSDLERRRIAADIHDGVVQDLVGTSFTVTAAAESAAADSPELARDLQVAAVGTRRSLQSLRSLLVDIYPPNLHEHGLEAALIDLLAPASNLGIEAELTLSEDSERSSEATALVYRVLQEAVRNVFRHANATTLSIAVLDHPDHTHVTIEDNGTGFSASQNSGNGHMGLRLLADLTADAGARFAIESVPGTGTTLRLDVPR